MSFVDTFEVVLRINRSLLKVMENQGKQLLIAFYESELKMQVERLQRHETFLKICHSGGVEACERDIDLIKNQIAEIERNLQSFRNLVE